jgi:hypothetical protein
MNRPLRALVLTIAAALIMAPLPVSSYVLMLTSANQPNRWNFDAFAVRWNVNTSAGENVRGSRSGAQVISAAFASWTNAPNTQLRVSRGPDSGATEAGFSGSSENNINLICFVCDDDIFDGSTLAVTITTFATGAGGSDGHGGTTTGAGQILDGDLLFNPDTDYSTGGAAGMDLETVAVHEIGHFFGLDHSAVVSATMFPFADDMRRTLGYDDVAGISHLYPQSSADVQVGRLAGNVRFPDNAGVFGAHVFADSTTGKMSYAGFNVRKTPISALTDTSGNYVIEGVPADSYIVVAEPLNEPVTDSNVDGYADAFNRTAVQTNFTTRWH